jgi:hypothetical protein
VLALAWIEVNMMKVGTTKCGLQDGLLTIQRAGSAYMRQDGFELGDS